MLENDKSKINMIQEEMMRGSRKVASAVDEGVLLRKKKRKAHFYEKEKEAHYYASDGAPPEKLSFLHRKS